MEKSTLWQEEVDLNSFDRSKQRHAVMKLGMIGGEKAIQMLISILQNSHKDTVIRARAATMLGSLKAQSAVIPLVNTLGIKQSTIPICSARALGDIGNNSHIVLNALQSLSETSHSDLRKAVKEALAKLGAEDLVNDQIPEATF